MIYYHVSSILKEGQKLTHDTKNNKEICELICLTDVSSYKQYINLIENLESEDVFNKTDRDAFKWSCESIFEMIRSRYYSHMPSRVWGIFVSESLKEAYSFYKNYRKGETNIFEIQPESEVYKLDMGIFTEAEELLRREQSDSNYEKSIKLAHEYWKKNIRTKCIEYLFDEKEVTVGKKVLSILLTIVDVANKANMTVAEFESKIGLRT